MLTRSEGASANSMQGSCATERCPGVGAANKYRAGMLNALPMSVCGLVNCHSARGSRIASVREAGTGTAEWFKDASGIAFVDTTGRTELKRCRGGDIMSLRVENPDAGAALRRTKKNHFPAFALELMVVFLLLRTSKRRDTFTKGKIIYHNHHAGFMSSSFEV